MSGQEIMLLVLFAGLFAGILSGIPAMLAIAGVPFVLAVGAAQFGLFNLDFLANFPSRVQGIMANTLLMAVPLFVLMGVFLERANLAERMLRVLARLLGGSPLGMALSVLAFSTIIAASTGIIGATIVMLVMIALTPMLDSGVPKRQAAGLICASGTLGQIIPPSILLVLLGDQIGNTYLEAQQRRGNFAPDPVSVADLFAGALVPGLLLVGLYALWLLVTLRPGRAKRVGERQPVAATEVVFTFLPPLLLILAVLGSILGGIATATEAAGLGAVGAGLMAAFATTAQRWERAVIGIAGLAAFALVALKVAGVGRSGLGEAASVAAALLLAAGVLVAIWRLTRGRMLGGAMVETIKISGMVFGIVIAASMLSLVFRGFGGERAVEHLTREFPGGEMGALLAVMVIVFLLGFILEAIEIIYIVVPLLGPAVLAGDISPVWFAVLMAMNLQTSFLTPPFGFALFYFRSVAPPQITTLDIYRGVVPFVLIQILALAMVYLFPGLATWLPHQMFN
ncbi:TRAP transporter large permease [Pararhodobacter aggregans]|uniref:Tripartite transporter n=1 Tax=Pararhodobacter aggregans TaxID=404875 RepID=A0A2T7UR42_9RHOB|nr:TRAP transporter large permease subunit [Pararhodobacter aggregans]PTX01870.1 tripartite ATP-independent transporter DctM subunit [Pararhodobacter aggregans]PVE47068.1 tripartite transporter [Pararhodobacter aggregans]